MHKYEKKIIEIELEKETPCDLKHNDGEFHRAVNCIQQNIGFNGAKKYSFTIFICEDCLVSLIVPRSEWILIYCLKCSQNQWCFKDISRLDYKDKHICWTSCCPYCREEGEEVRVFFTD